MLMRLAVSVPSHCRLMQPAAERLAERLAAIDWQLPRIPILHNVDAAPRTDTAGLQQALAAQLSQPVRWTRTVERLAADGVSSFVECGPGKVLTGLGKRIIKGTPGIALDDAAGIEQARALLMKPSAG